MSEYRVDYILTRQTDRRLVQNVTVYLDEKFLEISDHNMVCAHVRLLDRVAPNRREGEERRRVIDRRRLRGSTDTSEHSWPL